METGRVVEIQRDLKFGIIEVDDTNEIVLFEKRSIQNLKWDKLRKGKNGTPVAFKLALGQADIIPKHAELVISVREQAAVEASTGPGWMLGEIDKVFETAQSGARFGFIKFIELVNKDEILGGDGMPALFNESSTEFESPITFDSIAKAAKTQTVKIHYKSRKSFAQNQRFATKIRNPQ